MEWEEGIKYFKKYTHFPLNQDFFWSGTTHEGSYILVTCRLTPCKKNPVEPKKCAKFLVSLKQIIFLALSCNNWAETATALLCLDASKAAGQRVT